MDQHVMDGVKVMGVHPDENELAKRKVKNMGKDGGRNQKREKEPDPAKQLAEGIGNHHGEKRGVPSDLGDNHEDENGGQMDDKRIEETNSLLVKAKQYQTLNQKKRWTER